MKIIKFLSEIDSKTMFCIDKLSAIRSFVKIHFEHRKSPLRDDSFRREIVSETERGKDREKRNMVEKKWRKNQRNSMKKLDLEKEKIAGNGKRNYHMQSIENRFDKISFQKEIHSSI